MYIPPIFSGYALYFIHYALMNKPENLK